MRFTADRAWCRTSAVPVWLLLVSCSLVVGELPEPVPDGGPGAGAGSGGSNAGANSAPAGKAAIGEGGQALPGGTNTGGSGTSGATASCDADGDEHQAAGKCGGDDCDDSDPNVFSGQRDYFAERQKQVDYDYDCSGAPEQEQLEPVVCSGVSVGACPTTQMGFLKALPACGASGAWGTCKKTPPLDTCDQQVIDAERAMRCR